MKTEQLTMSADQRQQLTTMLQSQGISQAEIDQIINGDYESYDTGTDLENAYGGLKKHGDVLEKLSDGYTMEELQEQGISADKIQQFKEMLNTKNLTVDNAKAIYQYSIGSNMILGIKRGTSKEAIKEQIIADLEESLIGRGIAETDIKKLKQFVQGADYQSPLHSNYDIVNEYMDQIGLQHNARVSVRTAMQSLDRCSHIDKTVASLEDGLGSTHLSKSMKLYRAVKSSYLEKGLGEGEDLSSLVGKSISNKGQTSTSPLYDSSFASLDDYDTVFEIYAPKGSRGSYIAELSAYDKTEQEVLLNPNDLYITGVQMGVTDKNGKTKNILQALCLSKDRECYKEIMQQQDQSQDPIKTYSQRVDTDNLPTKQNRFSKFFNQVRARFARSKSQQSQSESAYLQQSKPKEKKPWELEPEEITRIQNETAKIAQRYREQKAQEQQAPTQEAQHVQEGSSQRDSQSINNEQVPVQQPMVDMGDMEL